MDALFGTELSQPVKFVGAFLIVLAAIGVAAYFVRRFGVGALAGTAQRNRQHRLAVIDSADLDARRKLVIIRRDNVEHLLLIGGPTDVLVESNIVRAAPAQTARDTIARPAASEIASAPVALAEPSWPPVMSAAAVSEFAPRPAPITRPEPAFRPEPVTHADPVILPEPLPRETPARPPLVAQMINLASPAAPPRPPVESPPQRPAAEITQLNFDAPPRPVAQDLDAIREIKPELPPAAAQLAPAPRAPQIVTVRPAPAKAEPVPTLASSEEQNLADMAQRLEAALRRPLSAGTQRPTVTPAPAPAQRPAAPAPAPQRPAAATPQPTPTAPRSDAQTYENLQREMANLLGRQPGSS
jgi:flagellar biogenesis protein FliO